MRRLLVGVIAAAVASAIAVVAPSPGAVLQVVALVVLLVIAELHVIRLDNDAELPLSYAWLPTVAWALVAPVAAGAVVGAYLIAALVRRTPESTRAKVRVTVRRVVAGLLVVAVIDGTAELLERVRGPRAVVFGSLVAGIAALVIVDLGLRLVFRRRSSLRGRGPLAWSALASSAVLMAASFAPRPGGDAMGLIGPVLFSIPLWTAWYSFARLDAASQTYRQTIAALSAAPELGGLVAPGHAQRVATLSLALGRELHLPRVALDDLEAAALLHHIGQVTLDDPEVLTHPHAPATIAASSTEVLRGLGPLEPVAEVVAGEALRPGESLRHQRGSDAIASQVVRLASAFDELTEGDPARAGAARRHLRIAVGEYDLRVLEALDRLLDAADTADDGRVDGRVDGGIEAGVDGRVEAGGVVVA